MARNDTAAGGFKIPSGKSRIAVSRAVHAVLTEEGITQADLLRTALAWSGLNSAHGTWITTPGKGPAGILWDRRAVTGTRGYRCYPNTQTAIAAEQIGDPTTLLRGAIRESVGAEAAHVSHLQLVPGSVHLMQDPYVPDGDWSPYLFLGWRLFWDGGQQSQLLPDLIDVDGAQHLGRGIPRLGLEGIRKGHTFTIDPRRAATSSRAL